jgi:hypothetical protein
MAISRGVLSRGGGARFLPFLLFRGYYGSVKALIRTGPWYRHQYDRGTTRSGTLVGRRRRTRLRCHHLAIGIVGHR